jgi:hypothetical protein
MSRERYDFRLPILGPFCSPHGNDKVNYPTAMTRFATLIIAVSFCSNAAAAPLVTFESPRE